MIEVADVFRRFAADYVSAHGASMLPSHRRAIDDILDCRTAALGGQVWRCETCNTEVFSFHSCVMGKFSNGESAGGSLQFTVAIDPFALHYRGIPEHGHQLVRRSEGAFAQMWRHDRLNRFQLFGGIAARIDFSARQGRMSQPK
jgi:hypothetical protein